MIREHFAALVLLFVATYVHAAAEGGDACRRGCRPVTLPFTSHESFGTEAGDLCLEFAISRPGLLVVSASRAGAEQFVVVQRCEGRLQKTRRVASNPVSAKEPLLGGAVAVEPGSYGVFLAAEDDPDGLPTSVKLQFLPRDTKRWIPLLNETGTLEARPGGPSSRDAVTIMGLLVEPTGEWQNVTHVELAREGAPYAWLMPRGEQGLVPTDAVSEGLQTDWRTFSELSRHGAVLSRSGDLVPEEGLLLRGVAPGPNTVSGSLSGTLGREAPPARAPGRMGWVHRIHVLEPMDLHIDASSPQAMPVLVVREGTGAPLEVAIGEDVPPEILLPANRLTVPPEGLDLSIEVLSRDDAEGNYFLRFDGTRRSKPRFIDAGTLRLEGKVAGIRGEAALLKAVFEHPAHLEIRLPSASTRAAWLDGDGTVAAVSRTVRPHELLTVGDEAVVRSLKAATDPALLARYGKAPPEEVEEGTIGVIDRIVRGELALFESAAEELPIALPGLAPTRYTGPDSVEQLSVDVPAPGESFLALFGSAAEGLDAVATETLLSGRVEGKFRKWERVAEAREGWVESGHDIVVPGSGLLEVSLSKSDPRIDLALWTSDGILLARSRPGVRTEGDDACATARDGECDDGRAGSVSDSCEPCSDSTDCGPPLVPAAAQSGASLAAWLPAAGSYRLQVSAWRPGSRPIEYEAVWKHRSGELRERRVAEEQLDWLEVEVDSGRPAWRRTIRTRPGYDTVIELDLPKGRSPRLEVSDGQGRRLAKADGEAGASRVAVFLPSGRAATVEIVASSDGPASGVRLTVAAIRPPSPSTAGAETRVEGLERTPGRETRLWSHLQARASLPAGSSKEKAPPGPR